MTTIHHLLGSYRLRLVLAFGLAVLLALGIVLAALPRLLDDYLRQQDQASLETRADAMAALIRDQILDTVSQDQETFSTSILCPPVEAPRPCDSLTRALGFTAQGYVSELTETIALADVTVEVRAEPGAASPFYRLRVPLRLDPAIPEQRREPLHATREVTVPDRWWAQSLGYVPRRPVTISLANPYTSRAATLARIDQVLLIAAVIGLVGAVLVSLLLAQWLADPIRRLTRVSRHLAEGELSSRVALARGASPEVTELAETFNQMAERLQDSIRIISADRDRSREFVADVSHELRTPIAALRTFNELLREGAAEDPATREEFLEQSARQIERLDWLATNLLELSKLDSGLVALDLRPEDLRGVVESAVQQAGPVAQRKGVTLEMHLPQEPVRQLHDPPRIGQVLANLIGNAIKFTPPGGRVDIDLATNAETADVSVTDTGEGIPPEELPHIFDRFWRGSRTKERGSGSGLGLSIVKSIVDMHQGRIQVQSTPGAGTRVTVALPRMSVSSSGGARV
jgi:signal transduction histidine kinase